VCTCMEKISQRLMIVIGCILLAGYIQENYCTGLDLRLCEVVEFCNEKYIRIVRIFFLLCTHRHCRSSHSLNSIRPRRTCTLYSRVSSSIDVLSVGLSVHRFVTSVYCGKMADWIEMLFITMVGWMDLRNHIYSRLLYMEV